MDHARRLVVVANRLPVTRVKAERGSRWETSPGGLVSALAPILQARDGSWVGWPGTAGESLEPFTHDGIRQVPVTLSRSDLDNFYLGFANSTLWPLFHDAVRWPEYHRHWWWPYREVNERFARAVAATARDDDAVWVHDYHLMLVPGMLRTLRPELQIGFFLHIPFPPPELFGQLPWRRQLLEGVLGADLVGFQTQAGAQNFGRCASRWTDARGDEGYLELDGRGVNIDGFPISIDAERYAAIARKPETRRRVEEIRAKIGADRKILLGVDRLDYTKGIDRRLRAFETMLERYSNAQDRIAFVQVAVPSRELVPEYAQMRTRIEQTVGRINGTFGTLGSIPVHYDYNNLGLEELVAWYCAADVMVVTPLADGMNLVAKEFVASRVDERGVLVLSEFAGAARELGEAVVVNPHDVDGLANAFEQAIEMPEEQQEQRMRALRSTVEHRNVHIWADSFLGRLGA